MVTSADFVKLPYTPDLTQAGIAYVCRRLPIAWGPDQQSQFKQLQQIVAERAVDLAVIRHLTSKKVPHGMVETAPFTEPGLTNITIGGHLCLIQCTPIFQKQNIHRIRGDPDLLLKSQAMVSQEHLTLDQFNDETIYIFATLSALVTAYHPTLDRAISAGQPVYLIHLLPKAWAEPLHWDPLIPMSLLSEGSRPVQVELGGLNSDRVFQTEKINMEPQEPTLATQDFYTLSYLHTPEKPETTITITCPGISPKPHGVTSQWGNIWVYGIEILLMGYMTRGEFRHSADKLPGGRHYFPYSRTRTIKLGLPVTRLHPITDLFVNAKTWKDKDSL